MSEKINFLKTVNIADRKNVFDNREKEAILFSLKNPVHLNIIT
jgi:hypothetical protein